MRTVNFDNVLDVTLRDGGYLNQWQFSQPEIDHTLAFLYKIGIRKVEVGFLRSPENTTSSVNGCPSDFLARIKTLYPDLELVCMLNPAEKNWRSAIAGKLPYISLIRMTCTSELIQPALEIAHELHQQSNNLKVSLNLICVSSYSKEEISYLLDKIASSRDIDIIYFADSRGALHPCEVESIVSLAQKICDQPLGFHAHNTLGNAVENSNRAFACGCEWIDATLNGFGLAGGNTSLGDYLEHNELLPPEWETKTEITRFCDQYLSLEHPCLEDRKMYEMLASKNVDPVWSNQLVKKYQNKINEHLMRLPRAYYKRIEEVFAHQVQSIAR